MERLRLDGERVTLTPLPAAAATALPWDRVSAARLIAADLEDDWPQVDLLDVLPMQAALGPDHERFGIWLIIDRASNTVVGDIGFLGPPTGGGVEIGFSVVPAQRRRRIASEAARLLVAWALKQTGVHEVVARSEVGNVASAGTLTAAGFDRVGEEDGIVRWRFRAA